MSTMFAIGTVFKPFAVGSKRSELELRWVVQIACGFELDRAADCLVLVALLFVLL